MMGRHIGPVATLLCLIIAHSLRLWAADPYQPHPGYLQDTSDEKYRVSREVVIAPLEVELEADLRDEIFVEKLSKEFKTKYEERFGRTQAEQIFNTPSQFFEKEVQPGIFRTADEDAQEQKDFGNYMIKRTAEYHVDKWMKESPTARPVYELKEKIQNVNVQVKPGYKVKFRYSLSSNDLGVHLTNPYDIENNLSLRMGNGFGPGEVKETLWFMGYQVTKKVKVHGHYVFERDDVSLSVSRSLKANWSTSLTGARTDAEGHKAIVGLGWHD